MSNQTDPKKRETRSYRKYNTQGSRVTSPPKFSNRLQRSTTYSMKASLLFNPIAFSCGEPTYLVPAAQMPLLSFRLLTGS